MKFMVRLVPPTPLPGVERHQLPAPRDVDHSFSYYKLILSLGAR